MTEAAEEDEMSEVEEVPVEAAYRTSSSSSPAGEHSGSDEDQDANEGEEEESDEDGEEEGREIRRHQKAANRKGKKSGGFQSMGR
jgi:ATP-dependent RNA helicase DDX54/DBP10